MEQQSETDSNVVDLIPQWTFDEFAQGLAPYEYLYALRSTPVLQSQKRVLAANRAKAVGYGVDNFRQTYSQYLKEQAAATGNPFANTTDFTAQPLLLNCGDYRCDDLGVTRMDSTFGETVVCPHPIEPVRRLINIDSGEVKQEIAFKRGERWQTGIYAKSTLANSQKILELSDYGVSVTSENARELVRFLAALEDMNYDTLPEARSIGRLGWVKGYGFSPYVSGLVFDGGQQYAHAFSAVKAAGDAERWMELARSVRSGQSLICRLMLAASFASVLVAPMDALPFLVHVWGGAGAGKTVGLMLAASVWANPAAGEYVRSFNGTSVAGELSAAFCGSLPLCLDELQCIKGRKDFDDIIYMLCEGTGKNRGAKNGGLQKLTSWRNCTISTGEQPITSGNSGAGAMNRVIELNCGCEKLFDDPHAAVKTMTRSYGHAGRKFVEELQKDEIKQIMTDMQQEFYAHLIGTATDKQALSASLMLTADALADLLIFDDGINLTADDILPFLTTNAQADANRRAYDWLLGVIAGNPSKFSTTGYGEYQGECWGCVDEKASRAWIIKSTFDRLMSEQGYSAESFLSWAKRTGMIECSSTENRLTKRKRIKGVPIPAWCVCLVIPGENGLINAQGDTVLEDENAANH